MVFGKDRATQRDVAAKPVWARIVADDGDKKQKEVATNANRTKTY